MFQIPKLEELSFLVYGLGLSGLSVIKYFKRHKIKNFKVWDDKKKKLFKNLRPKNLNNSLDQVDFIILSPGISLIKEKRLKKFIETVHLIIDYKNIHSVNFSIKNKVDIISLDTKIVNELLVDARSCCKDTLKDVDILHIKIDQFYIDNNYYDVFPDKKKCKNLSIDLSFICLPDSVLKNIKKLLSEYKISVDKAFSHPYLKSFSNEKSKNIYEIAQKVMSGLNENEVFVTSKSSKNRGFFEKFFEFFK